MSDRIQVYIGKHKSNQSSLYFLNFTFKVMWARGCRRARWVSSWICTDLWDSTLQNISLTTIKDIKNYSLWLFCKIKYNNSAVASNCPEHTKHVLNSTSTITRDTHTCVEESRLVPGHLRRESLWHTVSSEDGRMERKSLNDLRRTPSVSSVTQRAWGESLGNNLDNRASSVLL